MKKVTNMIDNVVSRAEKVNLIAKEENDPSQNTTNLDRQNMKNLIKSNLGYWFLGFGISIVPILARQLGLAVIKSEKAGNLWNVLGSAEVAFLAIPLIITAVYNSLNKEKKDIFLKGLVLLLVIGCLSYAIFAYSYEVTDDINFMLIAWFNIVFLGFVLGTRILQHIYDIKELN